MADLCTHRCSDRGQDEAGDRSDGESDHRADPDERNECLELLDREADGDPQHEQTTDDGARGAYLGGCRAAGTRRPTWDVASYGIAATRFRSVPMPSAESTTSAPGQTSL